MGPLYTISKLALAAAAGAGAPSDNILGLKVGMCGGDQAAAAGPPPRRAQLRLAGGRGWSDLRVIAKTSIYSGIKHKFVKKVIF